MLNGPGEAQCGPREPNAHYEQKEQSTPTAALQEHDIEAVPGGSQPGQHMGFCAAFTRPTQIRGQDLLGSLHHTPQGHGLPHPAKSQKLALTAQQRRYCTDEAG